MYVTGCYWTITTIATVGYGDVIGIDTTERIFCSIAMIIGVLSFTIANGSFASIL
jgi:multisubunit Na+/H+ antiporter MnhF subunit